MNILIYSFYQGIRQFSYTEKAIAELASQSGAQVKHFSCNGILAEQCLPYAHSKKINPKYFRDKCKNCKYQRKKLWGKNSLILDEQITKQQKETILQIINSLCKESICNFVHENYPMGRISLYEFILGQKIDDLDHLTHEDFEEIKLYLKNTLYAYYGYLELLKSHHFDCVFISNTNYSTNNIVRLINNTKGIRTVCVHGALEFSRNNDSLFLADTIPELYYRQRTKYFYQNHQNISYQYDYSQRIIHHLAHLLEAKSMWVYSKKPNNALNKIRTQLDLDPNRPIILLSMSSQDEIFATDYCVMDSTYIQSAKNTFSTQMEWIIQTINFFKTREDLQLIIRIHPREYFSKLKAKNVSRAYKKYEEVLGQNYKNIRINRPTDDISLYDLFKIINLHLVSWSTVGLESALFGIPTISTTSYLSLYASEYVNLFSETKQGYYDLIDERTKKSLNRIDFVFIYRAWKWLLYDFCHCVLEFKTNPFWDTLNQSVPFTKKVKKKIMRILGQHSPHYQDYKKSLIIDTTNRKTFQNYLHSRNHLAQVKDSVLKEEKKPSHIDEKMAFSDYLSDLYILCKKYHFEDIAKQICYYLEQKDHGPSSVQDIFMERV